MAEIKIFLSQTYRRMAFSARRIAEDSQQAGARVQYQEIAVVQG
jgi:hypothetical protein